MEKNVNKRGRGKIREREKDGGGAQRQNSLKIITKKDNSPKIWRIKK